MKINSEIDISFFGKIIWENFNKETVRIKKLEVKFLDIHAEDMNSNKFLIEMQSQMEAGFEKRR